MNSCSAHCQQGLGICFVSENQSLLYDHVPGARHLEGTHNAGADSPGLSGVPMCHAIMQLLGGTRSGYNQ